MKDTPKLARTVPNSQFSALESPASFSHAEKPIFVVGCPRSGTTLLTTLLGRHSQLAAPPETYFCSQIATKIGASIQSEQEPEFSKLRGIRDLSIGSSTAKQIAAAEDQKEAFSIIANDVCKRWGKKRLVEKTPEHQFYWRQISSWFDDAKFLVVVARRKRCCTVMEQGAFFAGDPAETLCAQLEPIHAGIPKAIGESAQQFNAGEI